MKNAIVLCGATRGAAHAPSETNEQLIGAAPCMPCVARGRLAHDLSSGNYSLTQLEISTLLYSHRSIAGDGVASSASNEIVVGASRAASAK